MQKNQFSLLDLFVFTTFCALAVGAYALGGPCLIVSVLILLVPAYYGWKLVYSTAKDPILGWPLAVCVAMMLVLTLGVPLYLAVVELIDLVVRG